MNILYITNHVNIGGITSYLLTLATAMKERGHQVYLATSGGEMIQAFSSQGIECILVPMRTKSELSPGIVISAWKLAKFIQKRGIDIIHSHSRTTQVLGALLSRAKGVAHIFTCHGFFKPRLSRRLFPFWGEKVIAVSDAVKEHLLRDFKVRAGRIEVVYSGIDLEKFVLSSGEKISPKSKIAGMENGPVVGTVGRLSDVKGQSYLIEAMKGVTDKLPQAKLLIVGDGKMKEELLALAQALGISGNTFFLPAVSDTREVLSVMDVFVLPSIKEGLGLALMEAMASGLGVVASDVGGIGNLVQPGLTGLLVAPADSRALGLAILELLQDPQRLARMAKMGQEFIKKNFSQAKMARETERVYSQCIR